MVRKEYAKGFESYQQSVEKLYKDKSTKLYVLFSGEKNENGESWCSDCNDAQPFIDQAVAKFGKADDIFLTVDVGDRPFWKDMKNPFRGDPKIKLMVIPTLVRWNSVLRLEGDQCTKIDLLDMFFNED